MEGVAPEAASLAGHLKLGKLIVLYDDNKVSLAGPTDVTFTEDVRRASKRTAGTRSASTSTTATTSRRSMRRSRPPRTSPIRPVVHRGAHAHRLRLAAHRTTFAAHGEPLGADNVSKTKEALGWPLEPDFYRPRRRARVFPRDRRQRRKQFDAQWKAYVRRLETRQRRSGRASSNARCAASSRPICLANVHRRKRQRRHARCRRRRDERDRRELPELVGGSADLDPSTKTYLKGFGDFQPGHLRRPQHPLRRARTRDGRDRERHRAARRICCRSRRPSSTSSTT